MSYGPWKLKWLVYKPENPHFLGRIKARSSHNMYFVAWPGDIDAIFEDGEHLQLHSAQVFSLKDRKERAARRVKRASTRLNNA